MYYSCKLNFRFEFETVNQLEFEPESLGPKGATLTIELPKAAMLTIELHSIDNSVLVLISTQNIGRSVTSVTTSFRQV